MKPETYPQEKTLLAHILSRGNMYRALAQVTRNRGAPGVDGMTVEQLPAYLKANWETIRQKLLDGTYQPQAVKRVWIPKANGQKRALGIPTVLDRLIQQAIAQVLQSIWEPHFHDTSYGFRPGRSAHQAIWHAQSQVRAGRIWIIDLDLEAFFDTVNHDRLIHRLKQRTHEALVLRLINRYLKAGVTEHGEQQTTTRGVPQGGPLSPLLANIVLDELDWELDRRGHCFARYADDVQIYVKSKTAAERTMASVQRFIEGRLRLKVNAEKSAIHRPTKSQFLGFTFGKGYRLKVSEKSIKALKTKVRTLTRRTRRPQYGPDHRRIKDKPAWLESILRRERSNESTARPGQVDKAAVAMLSLEAMEQSRLPRAEKARYRQATGLEYGEISAWPVAAERESGPRQSTSSSILHELGAAIIGVENLT